MATISMQVVTVADGTLTRSRTISEADATRLIAAYQIDANVSVNGTASRAQVWNYIVTQMYQEWIDRVKAFEAAAATAAAQAGVTTIALS